MTTIINSSKGVNDELETSTTDIYYNTILKKEEENLKF